MHFLAKSLSSDHMDAVRENMMAEEGDKLSEDVLLGQMG